MVINFFKRRKYLLTFFSALFIISFIIGVIIFNKLNIDTKNSILASLDSIKIELTNNHIGNITEHILIISFIILISFTLLGYFSGIIYLFYEGMSIGFIFAILTTKYGFKGFIFCILYNILFKLIFLLLFLILLLKVFDIIKTIINYLIYKKSNNLINIMKKNMLAIFILVMFIFLNDLILYIFSNFMLKLLVIML